MSVVLWIVGEPGIGKTTLARALLPKHTVECEDFRHGLNGWPSPPPLTCVGQHCPGYQTEIAKPKWSAFGADVCAAGHWRGDTFDGADTLPISDIIPAMVYWCAYLSKRALTIIDGDKLSTHAANDIVRATRAKCRCILLENSTIAVDRRRLRGTAQNPSWVKGRKTKAHRFFDNEFDIMEKRSYDPAFTGLNEIVQDTLQLIHE